MLRAILTVLAACSPGSGSSADDAGPPDTDAAVGAEEPYGPCGEGTACAPGLSCSSPAGRTSGTCTVECATDDDCPDEGLCAATEPRLCARGCARSSDECPAGTVCGGVDGRSVCLGPALGDNPCYAGGGRLDLLFLVDDSHSMSQEQANLTANFGRLIDGLVHPPDRDDDGNEDWAPLEDLHVGVVSSDVGSGGHAVQTCDDPVDGDAGALQHAGNLRLEGCLPDYPSFLEGPRDGLDREFTCIATLGTDGCGFEQQLESVRRALVDRRADVNQGFLRDDTALAVVMVTDEDDCSAADSSLFDPDRTDLGVMNLRCHRFGDLLVPVATYVEALLGLRQSPERLTVAAITGVPPAVLEGKGPVFTPDELDAVLAAPEMQLVVVGDALVPSCDVAGLGEAAPPRRIVEVLRGVALASAGSAFLGSLCSADWSGTIDALVASIGRSLCAPVE